MRWLVLNLTAPLTSFGGETIDAFGVTRDFPALSALTGLLANALGYERHESDKLDALQSRIRFGSRRNEWEPKGFRKPKPIHMSDFQTAQLTAKDKAWTTRGAPEGRAGGAGTYQSPHIRRRDYHADLSVSLVLTLKPEELEPNLSQIAEALDRPARPLFIGRKPCLPSCYLNAGFVEAETARTALIKVPSATGQPLSAQWPGDEEPEAADAVHMITDARNWRSGLHGGQRPVASGRILPEGS